MTYKQIVDILIKLFLAYHIHAILERTSGVIWLN